MKLSSKLKGGEVRTRDRQESSTEIIVEVMEMDEMTKEEKLERVGVRTSETASICGLETVSRRQDRGGQVGGAPA